MGIDKHEFGVRVNMTASNEYMIHRSAGHTYDESPCPAHQRTRRSLRDRCTAAVHTALDGVEIIQVLNTRLPLHGGAD